jgi:hypothetical protein
MPSWIGAIRTLVDLLGPDSPGAAPYVAPGPGAYWKNGGNANGTGTSSLGTTDAGDAFQMFVAGTSNIILQSDGTFLTLTAPSAVLLLQAATNEARLFAGAVIAPTAVAGRVRVLSAADCVFTGNTGLSCTATSGNVTQTATAGQCTRTAGSSISDTYTTGMTITAGVTQVANFTAGGAIAFGLPAGAPASGTLLDLQNVGNGLGLGLTAMSRATALAIANPKSGMVTFDSTNNQVIANVGSPATPNFRKAAGGSIVSATCTNAQSITNNAAAAAITTWTVDANTNQDAAFNATSGVFTVPVAGFYRFTVAVEFAAAAATLSALFQIGVFVGGVVSRNAELLNPVAALSQLRQVQISVSIQLAAGATVDFRAFQNSGGAVALTATASTNYLSIELVS